MSWDLRRQFWLDHTALSSPKPHGMAQFTAAFLVVTVSFLWQGGLSFRDEVDLTVDLLQRSLEVDTPQRIRRLQASPMFWLHFPKCGTSFANAVYHLPGMCPGLDETLNLGNEELFGSCFESGFRSYCPTKCDMSLLHCDWPPNATHQWLTDQKYEQNKGRFVGLFRQPEQRLLSAYNDDEDLFRASPYPICRCCNETMTAEVSMDEFIKRWASWQAGQICGIYPGVHNLTQADVSKAVQRLEEGFAFVGLQEEWELSICLFHAKFGGKCLAVDFDDTRPSKGASSHTYDTSILNGWTDEPDRAVYAKAKQMFEADLQKYDISHETCKPCYEEAGLEWQDP